MKKLTITTHPGEVLLDEMNARGLKKMAFAKKLDLACSHFSDITRGKRSVTEPVAKKLEQHLGIPVKHWLQLQANYDHYFKPEIKEGTCRNKSPQRSIVL